MSSPTSKPGYALMLAALLAAPTLLALLPGAGATHTDGTITVCALRCDFDDLQSAIDHADPGDTIRVRAGLYPVSETIVVDRSVSIRGPQEFTDPRPSAGSSRVPGDPSSEAVFTGLRTLDTLLRVEASAVSVNGLSFRETTGAVLETNDTIPVSDVSFNYLIVDASSAGAGVRLGDCMNCAVEVSSVFDTATAGLHADTDANLVSFTRNEVARVAGAGILAFEAAAVLIVGNTIADAHVGIDVFDASGTINENDVQGATGPAAVRVEGDGMAVVDNRIHANGIAGDAVTTYAVLVVGPTTGTFVTYNDLTTSEGGLLHTAPTGWPDLDARHNYWGAATGPTIASNPGGTGLSVSTQVNYADWETFPYANPDVRIQAAADDLCGDGRYATIAAAIACADPGATLLVEAGVHAGGFTVDRALTMCAVGPDDVACPAEGGGGAIVRGGGLYPVWIAANDVTMIGFTVENPLLTSVDLGTAWVDPSLVVVFGDRATLQDLVLQHPAAPLGPGQSRRYTVGLNVGGNADDLRVEGLVLRDFTASMGPDGTCHNTPCRTQALNVWSTGSGFTIDGATLDLTGAGRSVAALEYNSNAGIVIEDVDIALPSGEPGTGPLVLGLHADAPSGAIVRRVTLDAPDGEGHGYYGVFGRFSSSLFEDVVVRGALHGIFLRSSSVGGNVLRDVTFEENSEGLRNYAHATLVEDATFRRNLQAIVLAGAPSNGGTSQGFAVHDSDFVENAVTIRWLEEVSGVAVDARGNHWGVYRRDLVERTMEDSGTGNDIDVACYQLADRTTRVCPTADFTIQRTSNTWPRAYTFTNASTAVRNPIVAWTWDLAPGQASGPSATSTYMPGARTIRLTVTDSEGFQSTRTRTLDATNAAPDLVPIGPLSLTEGQAYTRVLAATDADGDTLTFRAEDLPTGATFDANARRFSWTPGHAQQGTHHVRFIVEDGVASDDELVAVTVGDVPVAPGLSVPARTAGVETVLTTIPVTTTNPNGGAATIALVSGPAGLTLTDHGDGTATVQWTPSVGAAGLHAFEVKASAAGLDTFRTGEIEVLPRAALVLTRLGDFQRVASPGNVVALDARIANAGEETRSFTFQVASAFAATTPDPVTLAPGESVVVRVNVTVPAGGVFSNVALTATAVGNANVKATVSWRVDVPVVIRYEPDHPSPTVADAYAGQVVVTYLNGAPVAGATVFLRQTPTLQQAQTDHTGTTNAAGVFRFDAGADPRPRLPGDHAVLVLVTRVGGMGPSVLTSSYTVR